MKNLEINEREIIGAILQDDVKALYACQKAGLTADCFDNPTHRKIWEAIAILSQTNKAVDFVTIEQYMIDHHNEPVMPLLEQAFNICINPSNCGYHASLLADRKARRQTVALLKDATAQMEADETRTVQKHTEQIFQSMLMLDKHSKIRITRVIDHKDASLQKWEQARKAEHIGIPSSIKSINSYLGGWRASLGIIGAYRGVGKSTFVRQEALYQAQIGKRVALFTLEDPDDIAASRIAGNIADISAFHLDIGTAPSSHIEAMAEGFDKTKDLPLWLINDAYTMEEILSVCAMLKQRYGLDIVYIDHIQYIAPQQLPNMNRVNTVSVYSHQLAMAAKKLGCAIVCASQFSRACEQEDRKPRLSDLRDSGSLEQDARQVLLLYKDKDADIYHIEVAKNNFGVSGKEVDLLRLDGKQRFEERITTGYE